jgi:phosphoserine phosphatase
MGSEPANEPTRAPESCASSSSVVIFDFDGTLVSRDSFFDFAVRYCLRRLPRLLIVGAVFPVAMFLGVRSRRRAGSALLWAMTVGASTRGFVTALRQYARFTLPRFANEAIFAELAREVQKGNRVVIATGTLPVLVRGLLAARDFGQLPIAGSRLRRSWGGFVAETHCVGRVKVRELYRRFDIVGWSSVYTDSFADRPLLRGARDVTLVGPSRRTLSLTRRLIGPGTALRVVRPR